MERRRRSGDEAGVLQELAAGDVPAEVVAEIGAIEQVKELTKELLIHFFAKLQVFGHAQVHIDEWRAAQRVKPDGMAGLGIEEAIPQGTNIRTNKKPGLTQLSQPRRWLFVSAGTPA